MSFPKSLHDALNYNEQKVQWCVAQCFHTAGYLGTAYDLSVTQKPEGHQLSNSFKKRAGSKPSLYRKKFCSRTVASTVRP